ncbi:MAG TPA: hypothetical protein DEH78_28415 [Solibacterales bacterium]|nr:hypothetical protein [Bryobacterales bacterium]
MRIVALLPFVALAASAATLERLTLDDMILRSTSIVRARVGSSAGLPVGRVIYTRYYLDVTERWKGGSEALNEVFVPGGAASGLRQTFSGAPRLEGGREYVLFLWRSPATGRTHVIGLSQGALNLKSDGKGGLTVERNAGLSGATDAAGRAFEAEALGMSLDALRERVRRAVSTVGASR